MFHLILKTSPLLPFHPMVQGHCYVLPRGRCQNATARKVFVGHLSFRYPCLQNTEFWSKETCTLSTTLAYTPQEMILRGELNGAHFHIVSRNTRYSRLLPPQGLQQVTCYSCSYRLTAPSPFFLFWKDFFIGGYEFPRAGPVSL